jgi:hypothetical protein
MQQEVAQQRYNHNYQRHHHLNSNADNDEDNKQFLSDTWTVYHDILPSKCDTSLLVHRTAVQEM